MTHGWFGRSDRGRLLLDVQLPVVDGLTVCRRLRAAGTLTPILLLTARDTTADKVSGLDSGADDYLAKPFDFPELLARLRALLRRGSPLREARIRVADLTFDPAARLVERRGRPIVLTKRELGILETLLRRPGWIVSRDAIIESVWGYAITCHKAQGSQWENVIVYDDGFGRTAEDRARWLYTAITRAERGLVILQ